jgi:hypothetical protein
MQESLLPNSVGLSGAFIAQSVRILLITFFSLSWRKLWQGRYLMVPEMSCSLLVIMMVTKVCEEQHPWSCQTFGILTSGAHGVAVALRHRY